MKTYAGDQTHGRMWQMFGFFFNGQQQVAWRVLIQWKHTDTQNSFLAFVETITELGFLLVRSFFPAPPFSKTPEAGTWKQPSIEPDKAQTSVDMSDYTHRQKHVYPRTFTLHKSHGDISDKNMKKITTTHTQTHTDTGRLALFTLIILFAHANRRRPFPSGLLPGTASLLKE